MKLFSIVIMEFEFDNVTKENHTEHGFMHLRIMKVVELLIL